MAGRITIDGLSDSLKDYIESLGLTEEQVNQLITKFKNENIGDLSTLSTENKTVVGAINEVDGKTNKNSLTTTIGNYYTTPAIVNSIVDGNDYQTSSEVQQTVDELQAKVIKSGGYNLIHNGSFENGTSHWFINKSPTLDTNQSWTNLDGGKSLLVNYTEEGSGIFQYFPTEIGETYGWSCYIFNEGQMYVGVEDCNTKEPVQGGWQYLTGSFTATKKEHVFIAYGLTNTTGGFYIDNVCVCKGLPRQYSPNPNEVYDGETTIDKDGIKVKSSNINVTTEIDSDSFRVVDNASGGTVAEFSKTANIPNLTSGTINAQNVYANNVATKSSSNRTYYVQGSTGVDAPGRGGSWDTAFRTVQYVINNCVEDIINSNITIHVGGPVSSWNCNGRSGRGRLYFVIEDDCVISKAVEFNSCTNSIVMNGTSNKQGTLLEGIVIRGCTRFDIGWLSFRGKNWSSNQGSCNINIDDGSRGTVKFNDFNGCDYAVIVNNNSEVWFYNNKGSNINHYIGIGGYTKINLKSTGEDICPDYTGHMYGNAGHTDLYYVHDGANFIKTPSDGWSPSYTPTQKTQVWDFTKIWSDETLNGWSDRQELQQGYSSTWATGRWTGYMQMTDDMLAIRNTIAGGTNLSGRIYVQRTSSSGLASGSKLCLYASDGTAITTTTTINRSQGVWVPLSSAIVEKIKNGSITYFYLKADADNQSTFFKCESNAKIEITYTN